MKKPKFRVSTQVMAAAIRKLELKKGDVILVREPETLRYLSMFPLPEIDFKVPLVFSPGGIEKLSRTDLMNLIEQLDEQDASQVIEEAPRYVPI